MQCQDASAVVGAKPPGYRDVGDGLREVNVPQNTRGSVPVCTDMDDPSVPRWLGLQSAEITAASRTSIRSLQAGASALSTPPLPPREPRERG